MKTWIKLYTEVIHDRKLWKLKPIEQLSFFYLCAIAGIEDNGGILPEMDDLELELQMPLKLKRNELESVVSRLLSVGLLSKDETGVLKVSQFEKRQMSCQTEAERKAAYRDKKRTVSGQKSGQMSTEIYVDCPDSCPDTCPDSVPEMSTVEEEVEEEVEEDKEVNKICAEAQKRKTSNPDDPAFWQRTFGPRAEMAHAFHIVSGITPIRNEFGRWQNDLKDLQEANITIPEMENAVREMRAENLTIKAPGSILAMARKLKSNPQPVQPQKKKTYSFTEVGEMMKRGELVI